MSVLQQMYVSCQVLPQTQRLCFLVILLKNKTLQIIAWFTSKNMRIMTYFRRVSDVSTKMRIKNANASEIWSILMDQQVVQGTARLLASLVIPFTCDFKFPILFSSRHRWASKNSFLRFTWEISCNLPCIETTT